MAKEGPGRKRSVAQKARDQRAIAQKYLEGLSLSDILKDINSANSYKLCHATITRDLQEIRAEWIKDATQTYDQRLARELASIDNLEREAWAAWKRSQTAEIKELNRTTDTGKEKATTKTTKHGDPRYLDHVHKCIAARIQLLGLAAPDVHVLQGAGDDGAITFTLDLGDRTLEE